MSKFLKMVVIVSIVAVAVSGYLYLSADDVGAPNSEQNIPNDDVQKDRVDQESGIDPPTEPVFNKEVLETVLDQWKLSLPSSSSVSVVVLDEDGNDLISHNADQIYFAASMYKLYVAYAGYQQVDTGIVEPDKLYVGDATMEECLDLMIRASNSPCAEKLWNELGKQELTDQLNTYGISTTNMAAVTTTAADAAKLLRMVVSGEGLSEQSKSNYLDSMLEQPALYRRGLPAGFSNRISVYNKVGWNLTQEWHDSAIIELADGRRAIISVFSDNVGSTNIAKLSEALESVINF